MILILIGVSLLEAQNQTIKFKHYMADNGLSQNWVHCILQDKYGFLWVGTESGLNRFDGNEFKIYKHTKDKTSLPNSTVMSLLEDSQGNLWVGTNHGLALYNRKTDGFIKDERWTTNIVNAIAEDDKHNLWIGTYGYVFYLDVKTNRVNRYGPSNSRLGLSSGIVNTLFIDSKKNVWIGTDKGLNLFNKTNQTFIHYFHSERNIHSISNDDVRVIYQDKSGRIWIGTQKGLDILRNPNDLGEAYFIHHQNVNTDNSSITAGKILSLEEDNQHNLWIGSENGGLDKLNLQEYAKGHATFIHFKNNSNNENTLGSNSIHALYLDKQGILWIGTNSTGLDVLYPGKKFETFSKEPGNSNSLGSNLVNTFLEDENYVWIGTEGGLDRYDKAACTFKHFAHNPSDKTSISSNAVWALKKDSKETLWVGTYDGGLNKFNCKTEAFSHYVFNASDTNSLSSNNVYSLLKDRKGNLWIGTMGGGLNLFDKSNGTFKSFKQGNSNIYTNYVQHIIETRDGDILLVNLLTLERFDPKQLHFYNFKLTLGNDVNTGAYKVLTVMEDSRKNIWVGTDAGLLRIDKQNGQMLQFQTEDGLPDNMIKALLDDQRGNLWVACNKGLSKVINAVNSPNHPKFKNYTVEDGLQANEFRQRSCLKGSDGYFYFGGIKGFNRFHPDSVTDNPFIPEVVLTDFLVSNKSMRPSTKGSVLPQDITITHEISIPSTYPVVGFKFAALNYVSSEKNQYAYKMEGFEKEWNYVGNKHEVTYTNLEPGKYTFRVKASNNDGIWNEKGLSVKITILPPWWKAIWFRFLVLIGLVSTITLFFFFKIEAYRRRQEELTEIVNQRTHELKNTNIQLLKERSFIVEQQEILKQANTNLKEQNKKIEEYVKETSAQNKELKRINEQLLEKQTKIEEQSEELAAHSDNLREVNELLVQKQNLIQMQARILKESNRELSLINSTKDKIFSIIAHDLRNPFHAVSGFSEILLRDYDKLPRNKIEKYLDIINRSSVNGNALLENLLNWSRAQTGRMVFEPVKFDLFILSKEITDLLETDALRKNIRLTLDIEPGIMVYADENMIKTVLRNLISNAIKFTEEQGEITIKSVKHQSHVEVAVIDTGVGIPEQNIKLLFNIDTNISTKGTAMESGTGLGLILCKEFIVRNGGTIWVESELDKGSTFKFTLPLA